MVIVIGCNLIGNVIINAVLLLVSVCYIFMFTFQSIKLVNVLETIMN